MWLDAIYLNAPLIRWPLTALYLLVLLLVSIYGLHRYWLVWLYYRNRQPMPRPLRRFQTLPRVTVQLPMFNESQVAERIIDAACSLSYPRDLLHIQVLDDSTDGCAQIAHLRVEHWKQRGLDIEYIHRQARRGYKAGALAEAFPRAKGQFIAIFDADFIPPPHFLKSTIHYFTDPKVGMVQARWSHLNREDSLLTRSQAIFLDGHFLIEHTARNRSDRWFNFNGTAGVWRRQAIESAGGWQHDTLTEDVDLSYRAQLAGWSFVFLPRLKCPAELPPEINAFKAQQHRWTKGSIQTAKKLLPTLLMSDIPCRVKVEAFFHLTSPMVYVYLSLMVLLFYPAFFVNIQPVNGGSVSGFIFETTVFALGTASAGVFYTVSQREQRRSLAATIAHLPALMSIGIGTALNNARGCIEALLGHQSEFTRTPKYRSGDRGKPGISNRAASGWVVLPTPSIKLWMSLLEIGMGLYCLECSRLSLNSHRAFISFPFLLLFASGYLYVGLSSMLSLWLVWRDSPSLPRQPGGIMTPR